MSRVVSKDVECPFCGAQPGEPCFRSGTSPWRVRHGSTVTQSHTARVEAARAKQEADR